MKKPIILRIYKDDQLVAVRQFLEDQVSIGRPEAEVQLKLEDDSVAPVHAMIEKRGDQYFVSDLGSESGTVKNGQPILDDFIDNGDELRIGGYRIEFFLGVPKPKEAPPVLTMPPTQSPPPPKSSVSASPQTPPAKTPDLKVASAPVQAPAASVEPSQKLPEAPAATNKKQSAPPARPKPQVHTKAPVRKGTYAPGSSHSKVTDIVKPGKGGVVEVLVAWKERVISTYHFTEKGTITVGTHPSVDVHVPLYLSRFSKIPLIQIQSLATIVLGDQTQGELIRGETAQRFDELKARNRLLYNNNQYLLTLEQGEMVRISVGEDVSIYVRYTSHTPKPLAAPVLDFTGSEFLGVLLATVLTVLLATYTYLATPDEIAEEEEPDIERAALIIPNRPKPPAPKVVTVEEQPPVEPRPAQTTQKVEPQQKVQTARRETKKPAPSAPAQLAPRKNNTKKAFGSVKQGGAIKTARNEGSQVQQPAKDASKSGIFSVFGGGGAQDKISQGSSGSGELAGLADSATGQAGFAENRAGEGLGSKFRETGAGGKGRSNVGVSGLDIKTRGRGSGEGGYGDGTIGGRQGVSIQTGGAEEEFHGTIDKEAIRRAVRSVERSIRTCYERVLNRQPDFHGKLMLEWDIGEQGRFLRGQPAAGRSTVTGSEGAQLASCVINVLSSVRFPEPPRNQVVRVVYPFVFNAK